MGFKESIGKIIFGNDSDEDFVEETETEEEETLEEEEEEEDIAPVQKQQKVRRVEFDETEPQVVRRTPAPQKTPASAGMNMSSGSMIEMKVVKPEKLENVTQIADYLISRKTVLLNLEDTQPEMSRRLIDFLNGVSYAINGKIRKVANRTYIVTPSNVDISSEDDHGTEEFVRMDKE